jgi:phosphatidylserine/phosphatidylglycerophosphate/cardiolipin synthase-like enzyme
VCFVPGSDCGARVASEIDQARHAIRVQAYTFTSPRIAHALARARRRGVDVLALLDARESHLSTEAAAIRTLLEAGVPLRFDGAHSTAHNKVLVIDAATVVTGSFNFSVSAERYSAENVLFVRGDPPVVQAFLTNFAQHWAHSGAAR